MIMMTVAAAIKATSTMLVLVLIGMIIMTCPMLSSSGMGSAPTTSLTCECSLQDEMKLFLQCLHPSLRHLQEFEILGLNLTTVFLDRFNHPYEALSLFAITPNEYLKYLLLKCYSVNIAKGTTDPRVEFSLPN